MKKRNKNKNKKPHIKHPGFLDRNFSSLEDHPRSGNTLKTPFSVIQNLSTPRSWASECIPNILWACLLSANLPRDQYLYLYRRVIISAKENVPRADKIFITHNYLSTISDNEFDAIFKDVIQDEDASKYLSYLLYSNSLPDLHHWRRHFKFEEQDLFPLAKAVSLTLDHQSQASTDIRWLKLMYMIVTGRMIFGLNQADLVESFRLYPDRGEMTHVRPAIRSMELAFRGIEFGEIHSQDPADNIALPEAHSEIFWTEMYQRTPCLLGQDRPKPTRASPETIDGLFRIGKELDEHFHSTLTTTGIDARHDGSFGLVFYAIHLGIEISSTYNHRSAVGRLALRTVVELAITLSYLVKHNTEELWLKYRDYGNGQTKLSFLKNISKENVPRFIDLELLEALANEDKWLEFNDVKLGAWNNKNLRSIAEDANKKDMYDGFYDICSGYTHGHWIGVRDSSFVTCANPLHRHHRIPSINNFGMKSACEDICTIINGMLDDLIKIYPGFEPRVIVPVEPLTHPEN